MVSYPHNYRNVEVQGLAFRKCQVKRSIGCAIESVYWNSRSALPVAACASR